MKLRAVLWDIDGTLIDSEPLHQRALEAVCASYGADISDLAEDAFVGVNLHGVWQELRGRFPSDLKQKAWIDAINTHYRKHARDLKEIRGAKATVNALDQLGIRQVAVSNSNRVVVDANLKALDLGDVFEFSISLDDVAVPKPDPFPYILALKRLGLNPCEAVAVEDSRSGVASAVAAGIRTLGLGSRLGGAHQVIRSLAEIMEIFQKEPEFGL